jgi:hypothetical protein
MRKILKKRFERKNKRHKYKATFQRFGSRTSYKWQKKTILLTDLIDGRTHKFIADHIWLDCGKKFDEIKIEKGDNIQFYARVKIYEKGYETKTIDYGLAYPSKVNKLRIPYNIKK